MYCSNCGSVIDDNADVCVFCGHLVNSKKRHQESEPSDLLAVLSFFVPVVGIVLYFVYKDEFYEKARKCLKAALISMGIKVALVIIIKIINLCIIGGWYRVLF